ncbi:hypothetical protein FOL47_001113 [Perkinsus chesapeaki]|uniref:Uncharacterized protein n=1 Tax=Perkinsus chesapeaki TaxID=330153 RepID=A0A7J6MJV7_PERCH|nr:hypothetical protein FOL47_001113 [Perkinsus chesapeaki]
MAIHESCIARTQMIYESIFQGAWHLSTIALPDDESIAYTWPEGTCELTPDGQVKGCYCIGADIYLHCWIEVWPFLKILGVMCEPACTNEGACPGAPTERATCTDFGGVHICQLSCDKDEDCPRGTTCVGPKAPRVCLYPP